MNEKGNIIIWVSIMLMILALSAMLSITIATLSLNMRKDDEKVKQAIYLAEGIVDVDYILLAEELLIAKEIALNELDNTIIDESDNGEEFSEYFKDYFKDYINNNKNNIESKLKNKQNYTSLIDKESRVEIRINERLKWINSSEDYLIPLIIKVTHKKVVKIIKVDFIIKVPDYNIANNDLINFITIENYRYGENEE